MEDNNRRTVYPVGRRGASHRVPGSGRSVNRGWLALAIVLAMVVILPCSAAPPPFARLDLNQPQTYRNVTVSSLETVDLMDLSVSRVTLSSTVGNNSDIKTIPFPEINNIRRVFSGNTATWHGNTLTILGGTDTTVPGAGFGEYTFFIDRYVPVVRCEVPEASGDVFFVRANTTSRNYDFHTLVESLDQMYLLHTKGIAGIQKKPGGRWTPVTVGGPWNIDPDNIDFGKILLENEVPLANFLLNRPDAQDISLPAGMPPIPSDYVVSAVEYIPPTEKIITYAAWPVVITDGDNTLVLNDKYNKRSGEDLLLAFANSDHVKNITSLLVKDDERYNITVRVNMEALEEAGGSISPDQILSGNPFLTILRETGLGLNDFKKVVSYSVYAVGNDTPPHSTHFSKVNITPGYGTSGYALRAGQVTIPHGDLQGLLDGTFDVYALGADSDNNVVALDHGTIDIGNSPIANFTNVTSREGPAPLDVSFQDLSMGTLPMTYQWNFGDGTPNRTDNNPTHTYNTPGLYNVTLTVSNAFGFDTKQKVNFVNVTTPVPTPTPTTPTPTPTPTPPPLQADFTADHMTGFVPLTVRFTDTSTGPHDTWSWSFGDGGTSTAQNPAHRYTAVGTYTVSLTVRQGTGTPSTKTKEGYITVVAVPPPPVAQFTANVTSGYAPLAVRFTDLSSGSIYEWFWTFGDGWTSSERSPVHTYSTPGNYTVSLRVRGLGGFDTETRTNYISVLGVPPVADFVANVTSGDAPLAVQFTDYSTGGPTAWSWTFGDGAVSTAQNPVHVYHYNGTYTVSLTVANDYGIDVKTRAQYINVTGLTPPPPGLHADFAGAPRSGFIPLAVLFADASTGYPTSWNWSFGDGTYSTEQNPAHTYSSTGGFTVSLTVSNGTATDTVSRTDYIIAARRGGGGGGGVVVAAAEGPTSSPARRRLLRLPRPPRR